MNTSPAPTAKQQSSEAGGWIEDRKLWEVYARRKYDEPLYQVGTVAADDPDLGRVYARTIFNEFPWIEMVLIPRDTIIPVIEA